MRPVLRLFGPPVGEVVRFAAETFGRRTVIVWGIPPEVHVKCDTPEILETFLQRFKTAVFSVTDQTIEATVGGLLVAKGRTLATAESCTGGLIGHMLTGVPGMSACYRAGFVTYANDMKTSLLGVPQEMLQRDGAVSEAVVLAMAQGARGVAKADWAVAVSGMAGPAGGTPEKPVGTIWMAVVGPDKEHNVRSICHHLTGDRAAIKQLAAAHALNLLRIALLGENRDG